MPEITIKYQSPQTLKVLKALSELLGFTVSASDKKKKNGTFYINGVPIIEGDKSVDISDMCDIISRNKMDAKQLRKAWQRKE